MEDGIGQFSGAKQGRGEGVIATRVVRREFHRRFCLYSRDYRGTPEREIGERHLRRHPLRRVGRGDPGQHVARPERRRAATMAAADSYLSPGAASGAINSPR